MVHENDGNIELDGERAEFCDDLADRRVVVLVGVVQLSERIGDQQVRPPVFEKQPQACHSRGGGDVAGFAIADEKHADTVGSGADDLAGDPGRGGLELAERGREPAALFGLVVLDVV